jgi:hypothetical protein
MRRLLCGFVVLGGLACGPIDGLSRGEPSFGGDVQLRLIEGTTTHPVSGLTVVAVDDASNRLGEGVTDASGVARFRVQPAGAAWVVANDGHGRGVVARVTIEARGLTDLGERAIYGLDAQPAILKLKNVNYEERLAELDGQVRELLAMPEADSALVLVEVTADSKLATRELRVIRLRLSTGEQTVLDAAPQLLDGHGVFRRVDDRHCTWMLNRSYLSGTPTSVNFGLYDAVDNRVLYRTSGVQPKLPAGSEPLGGPLQAGRTFVVFRSPELALDQIDLDTGAVTTKQLSASLTFPIGFRMEGTQLVIWGWQHDTADERAFTFHLPDGEPVSNTRWEHPGQIVDVDPMALTAIEASPLKDDETQWQLARRSLVDGGLRALATFPRHCAGSDVLRGAKVRAGGRSALAVLEPGICPPRTFEMDLDRDQAVPEPVRLGALLTSPALGSELTPLDTVALPGTLEPAVLQLDLTPAGEVRIFETTSEPNAGARQYQLNGWRPSTTGWGRFFQSAKAPWPAVFARGETLSLATIKAPGLEQGTLSVVNDELEIRAHTWIPGYRQAFTFDSSGQSVWYVMSDPISGRAQPFRLALEKERR